MPEGKCDRKWRHRHLDGGFIEVFSRSGYGSRENLKAAADGTHRLVVIPDDGSICNRNVTPTEPYVPSHWYGTPGECMHSEEERRVRSR